MSPGVPADAHGAAWIAGSAALVGAVPAVEAVACRVGVWMRWREDPRDSAPRPWSWGACALGAAAVGAPLACLPPATGLAAGLGVALGWYLATLDMKERWVADHGVLLLLVTGLEASPFCGPLFRVHGLALLGAVAAALVGLRAWRSRASLGWDGFSGGDVWFPIAMGAWLGPRLGVLAMALYLVLETAATASISWRRPAEGSPKTLAERLTHYDRATDTVPAVVYMALAFSAACCMAPVPG